MPKIELSSGGTSEVLELFLRGAVYALTGVATLVLVGVFSFAVLVALGGTGGFTSSPPPEHPAWFGLAVTVSLYVLLQWGFIRLQAFLLALLDRRFGGSGN